MFMVRVKKHVWLLKGASITERFTMFWTSSLHLWCFFMERQFENKHIVVVVHKIRIDKSDHRISASDSHVHCTVSLKLELKIMSLTPLY